MNFVVLLFVKS